MKFIFKIFVLFFPIGFLLLLPQVREEWHPAFAITFIVGSIFAIIFSTKPASKEGLPLSLRYLHGLALASLLLAFCIFLPVGGFLAQPLYLEPSQENAPAILVLASGADKSGNPNLSGYQRVLHGISLLKQERAPLLLVSTGFGRINGHAEAAWVASLTQLCGLNSNNCKILVDERIRTSKSEADYAAEILGQLGIKKILLVTSGSHLLRCRLVFVKNGIEVLPAPCHTPEALYHSMGHNLRSLNSTLHEWLGLIYYRLKNYF